MGGLKEWGGGTACVGVHREGQGHLGGLPEPGRSRSLLCLFIVIGVLCGVTGVTHGARRVPQVGHPRPWRAPPRTNALLERLSPRPLSWDALVSRVETLGCTVTSLQHRHQLDSLCRKPIALVFSRETDCPSCHRLVHDLTGPHHAEFDLLRSYITVVDGGNELSDYLLRRPYPLPRSFSVHPHEAPPAYPEDDRYIPSRQMDPLHGMGGNRTQEEEEVVRRAAQEFVTRPVWFTTHTWARLLRDAFAGQSEYVARVLFLFPHNGSLMTSVVNEDLVEGSDAHLHFYYTAGPFLRSAWRAVRVLDGAQATGV